MIVLDTHLWLWWVNQDAAQLKPGWIERVEGAIASRAFDLPEHHRDPQDRIIIAITLVHGATLLSTDA